MPMRNNIRLDVTQAHSWLEQKSSEFKEASNETEIETVRDAILARYADIDAVLGESDAFLLNPSHSHDPVFRLQANKLASLWRRVKLETDLYSRSPIKTTLDLPSLLAARAHDDCSDTGSTSSKGSRATSRFDVESSNQSVCSRRQYVPHLTPLYRAVIRARIKKINHAKVKTPEATFTPKPIHYIDKSTSISTQTVKTDTGNSDSLQTKSMPGIEYYDLSPSDSEPEYEAFPWVDTSDEELDLPPQPNNNGRSTVRRTPSTDTEESTTSFEATTEYMDPASKISNLVQGASLTRNNLPLPLYKTSPGRSINSDDLSSSPDESKSRLISTMRFPLQSSSEKVDVVDAHDHVTLNKANLKRWDRSLPGETHARRPTSLTKLTELRTHAWLENDLSPNSVARAIDNQDEKSKRLALPNDELDINLSDCDESIQEIVTDSSFQHKSVTPDANYHTITESSTTFHPFTNEMSHGSKELSVSPVKPVVESGQPQQSIKKIAGHFQPLPVLLIAYAVKDDVITESQGIETQDVNDADQANDPTNEELKSTIHSDMMTNMPIKRIFVPLLNIKTDETTQIPITCYQSDLFKTCTSTVEKSEQYTVQNQTAVCDSAQTFSHSTIQNTEINNAVYNSVASSDKSFESPASHTEETQNGLPKLTIQQSIVNQAQVLPAPILANACCESNSVMPIRENRRITDRHVCHVVACNQNKTQNLAVEYRPLGVAQAQTSFESNALSCYGVRSAPSNTDVLVETLPLHSLSPSVQEAINPGSVDALLPLPSVPIANAIDLSQLWPTRCSAVKMTNLCYSHKQESHTQLLSSTSRGSITPTRDGLETGPSIVATSPPLSQTTDSLQNLVTSRWNVENASYDTHSRGATVPAPPTIKQCFDWHSKDIKIYSMEPLLHGCSDRHIACDVTIISHASIEKKFIPFEVVKICPKDNEITPTSINGKLSPNSDFETKELDHSGFPKLAGSLYLNLHSDAMFERPRLEVLLSESPPVVEEYCERILFTKDTNTSQQTIDSIDGWDITTRCSKKSGGMKSSTTQKKKMTDLSPVIQDEPVVDESTPLKHRARVDVVSTSESVQFSVQQPPSVQFQHVINEELLIPEDHHESASQLTIREFPELQPRTEAGSAMHDSGVCLESLSFDSVDQRGVSRQGSPQSQIPDLISTPPHTPSKRPQILCAAVECQNPFEATTHPGSLSLEQTESPTQSKWNPAGDNSTDHPIEPVKDRVKFSSPLHRQRQLVEEECDPTLELSSPSSAVTSHLPVLQHSQSVIDQVSPDPQAIQFSYSIDKLIRRRKLKSSTVQTQTHAEVKPVAMPIEIQNGEQAIGANENRRNWWPFLIVFAGVAIVVIIILLLSTNCDDKIATCHSSIFRKRFSAIPPH